MTESLKTLWVPGPLYGLNDILDIRGSGRGKSNPWAAKKKKLASEIGLFATHQQLTKIGPCSWTYLLLEPHRKRDPGNVACGAQKVIEDALQDCELLPNDGWKHILDFKHWWAVDEKKPGVFVAFHSRILSREEMLDARYKVRS